MKGKHHIIIQNNKLRYEFDIKRNLTIIRGDSATGKTTLVNMIRAAAQMGDESGIFLRCDKSVRVLEGNDWKLILSSVHDSILFIDEENRFIKSQEFAEAARNSDDYFVIITREDLPNLPYSVDEIYGIHTSGKYHDLKRTYNELYCIYSVAIANIMSMPEIVITEDSNSGYEFFDSVCKGKGIVCKSAKGKSNLKAIATEVNASRVMIIGDGAAIGPEMNELYQLMQSRQNIQCFFPESFEWIILKAGIVKTKELADVLEHPEDYIESKEYFSWEQFFTGYLIQLTEDGYLKYRKTKLNENYLHEREKSLILKIISWWK